MCFFFFCFSFVFFLVFFFFQAEDGIRDFCLSRGLGDVYKRQRRYYGCEDNPECDFMSWQKPSEEKCPKCGSYMVEKGNKLVCGNEQCGFVKNKEKDEK